MLHKTVIHQTFSQTFFWFDFRTDLCFELLLPFLLSLRWHLTTSMNPSCIAHLKVTNLWRFWKCQLSSCRCARLPAVLNLLILRHLSPGGLVLKAAPTHWAFPAFRSKLEQPSQCKVSSDWFCEMLQTSEVLQVAFLWLILDSLKVFLLLLTSCAMK